MIMLSNFLATVLMGTFALSFMSIHQGAPCMIFFTVMNDETFISLSLKFVAWCILLVCFMNHDKQLAAILDEQKCRMANIEMLYQLIS